MAKNIDIKVRPWCPFCGQNVGRPQPPVNRKLGEFDVGTCQCGAVYTCDATGHNIGSAMIETLVYACNDDWDLAWELMPEDDYLSGRIENYDEETHQVLDQKHMDGRYVRGVLYFIRLHKDIAEVSARKAAKDNAVEIPTPHGAAHIPDVEPERDPKRKKKRSNKHLVKELVEARDEDALVDLTFDDIKVMWFMQRLLYDPLEAKRWQVAHLIGRVGARVATRKPGPVSDLLHRLFEASSDSAATHWGLVETIGSIIAGRPDIYGAFTRHIMRFTGHESSRSQAIWALGTIAEHRPDLIRQMPFYQLFGFLENEDPLIRGLMLRLLGRIKANEASLQIIPLKEDQNTITIYENGEPIETTVGQLAAEAVALIHENGE